ncbi:heavy metal translocating P-type ATPase metal-binding domain-containing protein [uncultured Roseivirga sp.]|uniref:heavy metal translocating P-type ATPase n=1 Tax=uncultured Roseivirga sp. TaxID=543088 RepID=UPI0030DA36DC|tara:strand:- start:122479 stop:124890 length:2412 start_codon:yes stop_codon:yes gene_type:complete
MNPLKTIAKTETKCYHCGEDCLEGKLTFDEHNFCCNGCKTVYEILSSNDLCDYYSMENTPGFTIKDKAEHSIFDYLDNESIKREVLDFEGEGFQKVTLYIPNVHCSSCIWLLENLDRLNPAVLDSVINFSSKKLTVNYKSDELSLRQLAEMLDSIGYGPQINLKDADDSKKPQKAFDKQLLIKMGIAGFCFGNVMLLSFPDYLGIAGVEEEYSSFFRYLSLALSIPVVFYAGSEYFTSALKSAKQKFANIDVPIAIGLLALFARSTYEVIADVGPGYFDSLVGLVFFLLIGKWFQSKTYAALSFDRDYQSYFPLAVQKRIDDAFAPVPVKELKKGDEVLLRNGEVLPADAILIDDHASIDYSFVTGESVPVARKKGDYVYAGGRQVGKQVRFVIQKEVSQSYLTQLWNNDAFGEKETHTKLIDKVSRYFTIVVLLIAVISAIYWQQTDPSQTWLVFTAVLIIACPCALALSTPFTVGSVMRVFGRNHFYLKNADVIEKLNATNTIVFDKTGTITETQGEALKFCGPALSEAEKALINTAVASSTHPLSRWIKQFTEVKGFDYTIESFEEIEGKGFIAVVSGLTIKVGSAKFLGVEKTNINNATQVHVSIGDDYKGYFSFEATYRKGLTNLLDALKSKFNFQVLSGDNDKEAERLESMFPEGSVLRFNQSPEDKLKAIKEIQTKGNAVIMLGDGLNDAGALQQSKVGIAITEDVSLFSPASDAILKASNLMDLNKFIKLAHEGRKVVVASFILSLLYNCVGISLAVAGELTPLFAAILMPLSSISVVVFTTVSVNLISKKIKLK